MEVEKNETKGVIYGVYAEMLEREIKENIKGGNVTDVKWLKAREDGNKNTPVLLTFEGNILTARVFRGCLSFLVKRIPKTALTLL